MTTIVLDIIAEALDRLRLTQQERAEIYHAWDCAPDGYAQNVVEQEDYFRSEAHAAWCRVRELRLAGPEDWLRTTLEEASNFASNPTKTDILAALARAERMLTP